MSVNGPTNSHVHRRERFRDSVTVPYPPDLVLWPDDEETVMVDPCEMLQTAQAMMFVDTAVVFPEDVDRKQT